MNIRGIVIIALTMVGMAGFGAAATSAPGETDSSVPSPGTEASLHRYIDALEKGRPNYEEMAPPLAMAVRQQLPQISKVIQHMGEFRSLTFKGVGPDGWDVYDAAFANGKIEWHIKPLAADGRVEGRRFNVLNETA